MYTKHQGTVIQGKQLGRSIDFPTINITQTQESFPYPSGTYRFKVIIDTIHYIGLGPWFSDHNALEIHLLDTNQPLYGKEVTFFPLEKIRDNQQFSDMQSLCKQIQQDQERVRSHPRKVITFGTFDYLHPGHIAYFQQAKQYAEYLITIVATDTSVLNIKGKLPDYNQQERLLVLSDLEIIDLIELGSETDHRTCLREYTPQVIYLGYDQHSFDNGLTERCKEYLPHSTIIRGSAVNPEQRKSSKIRETI